MNMSKDVKQHEDTIHARGYIIMDYIFFLKKCQRNYHQCEKLKKVRDTQECEKSVN